MVRIADLETGPYWKHMNMKTVASDDGKIRLVMDITENLKQFYGNIHGGVIASLLDSTIAVAVNQQLDPGEGASTVEIKLNYFRPVSEGQLWGEGKVIQKGKKIIVGQGEIKDDAGRMVAFGTATFMVVKVDR
ncbi:MAG: PaaI family thioesterase [Firmicutes bacterium HGW-Firmicutes-15]|nr:MAG: PaaI family thioesterase [Firmicutes bacterium HGW-Firmicutes-15]